MNFNPDPSKQAQEIIFSRKIQKACLPSIYFNNKSVKQVPSQKHLGMILDTKLNFQEHLKNVLNKVIKIITIIKIIIKAITETAKHLATRTTINNIQTVYQNSS